MATVPEIVTELLDQFADNHNAAQPEFKVVESIVTGLIAAQRVSVGGLDVLAAVTVIDTAIKAIQSTFRQKQDGLLNLPGVKELGDLLNACLSKPKDNGTNNGRKTLKTPPDPEANPAVADIASRTFVYWIEGPLPVIKPDVPTIPAKTAVTLIDDAFFEWKMKVNIRTTRLSSQMLSADAQKLANLNLKVAEIDGPSGNLALTTFNTLGPVGVNQGNLDMTFDNNEDWTESKFKSVVLHEIGHLLGLDHEPDPNSIMFFQTTGATVLKDADNDAAVKKALGIWGKSNLPPGGNRIHPLI